MKTQCCQPPPGSTQCNDCPLTVPLYRSPSSKMFMTCTHGVVGYCPDCALVDPGEEPLRLVRSTDSGAK